jgi:hypothetical protein
MLHYRCHRVVISSSNRIRVGKGGGFLQLTSMLFMTQTTNTGIAADAGSVQLVDGHALPSISVHATRRRQRAQGMHLLHITEGHIADDHNHDEVQQEESEGHLRHRIPRAQHMVSRLFADSVTQHSYDTHRTEGNIVLGIANAALSYAELERHC